MPTNESFSSRAVHGLLEDVAPGVARLGVVFVNVYFVGAVGESWVLVDTGLPHAAAYIRQAAAACYGEDVPPEAILLTHGHFDHAGSALELAEAWDVPIYAHPLERPYLTGQSDYPPSDPTMGGAIAQMSRLFPTSGYDFGERVQPLPEDGTVPGLPGWRWLHTPGHTAGHVSFYREDDRVLLAGDAFATMDLDSWTSQVTHEREISRPPVPFTTDWGAVRASIKTLAALEPDVLAAGHGLPIAGPDVATDLGRFGEHFTPPPGRYAGRPVRADERGVVDVPPPVPDPLPAWFAGAAVVAGAVLVALLGRKSR